jgi:hypothetical protein
MVWAEWWLARVEDPALLACGFLARPVPERALTRGSEACDRPAGACDESGKLVESAPADLAGPVPRV